MTNLNLYPLNDLAFLVRIKVPVSGVMTPLASATSPTAFLAVDAGPETAAADATLVTTPTYTGAGGQWEVVFDAAVLTPTLLDQYFADVTPYVIVAFPGIIRIAIPCSYYPSRIVQVG